MIPSASAPTMHRVTDAAAILTLAAVGAALILPDPYAAVPDQLRPGAWSQDTISAPAALALLALNARIRGGWRKGWLIWAGLVGYLIYAYGLYAFDRVMNPAYPLYLAILSLAAFAAFGFLRAVDPGALHAAPRPPPRRVVAGLFALLLALFVPLWLVQLLPAMAARVPLPGQTIFVLDLAFALPLLAVTALLLWRGDPVGDLLAIPMLMKVAVLGVSVFLGTFYAWAAFDGTLLPFDLALYALMGFGPAALILPVWRRQKVRGKGMTGGSGPRTILRTAREAILSRPVTFLLIVALAGALDVLLHMAVGDLTPRPPEFGALVNRFGFAPVVMAWIAMAFAGMGLTFLYWASRMGGSGLAKGLRYGLAIGLMIQVAMFEGVGLLGTPVIGELAMGLADAVPIFLMILLLGWRLAPDSPAAAPVGESAGPSALLLFALIYGGGRILAQLLGIIESGLDDGAVATVLWSFAMGAVIGLAWMMLADLRQGLTRVGGALAFGIGLYGVNWALFMTFVPMVFPDALTDTALRVGIDILLVTGAALLAGSHEAIPPSNS